MKIVVLPIAVYDPFFQQVYQGVRAAEEHLREENVHVQWLNIEDASPDSQRTALRELRSEEVDGIVICPVDGTGLNEEIGYYTKRDVPVATFCLDAPESGRFYHIGQDLLQSGRLAGCLLGRFLGGKGTIGIITGFFNIEGHEKRRRGCVEVLERDFPDVSISFQEENHDHWEEAYGITKKRLGENPELNGLYITAGGPFGAAQAVEEMGLEERMTILCFDFVPDTVRYIRKGVIDASIGQNPYVQGFRSVLSVFHRITTGEEPPKEVEYVDLEIGVRENIDYLGSARNNGR